ncbi:MAG TPA: hypothetical protein VEU33_36270, partial [Archangium sp.]|nr:hypothetical protein [Archangium sp.]
MGWPLRMFQEEGYYFVTSRCFQGRLLLRPSAEVSEVVGGVLARAVQQSAGNVRLHAFTFASNHFHLLVWTRGVALASFMQYLRANLSKKVGRLVDWSGGFWERRYSAEPVLSGAALAQGPGAHSPWATPGAPQSLSPLLLPSRTPTPLSLPPHLKHANTSRAN